MACKHEWIILDSGSKWFEVCSLCNEKKAIKLVKLWINPLDLPDNNKLYAEMTVHTEPMKGYVEMTGFQK